MHINRQVVSKRPTTVQMLKEALQGGESLTDVQAVREYSENNLPFETKKYTEFNKLPLADQDYTELKKCTGPYYIDFAMEP